MSSKPLGISYIDGARIVKALSAGIAHVTRRREHLNTINVFPIADGDTGTNLVFTLKNVQDEISRQPERAANEILKTIGSASINGARGNSGAILAQFFSGISSAVALHPKVDAKLFARACQAGSAEAWQAMTKPVAGGLPTVLDDFSSELIRCVDAGCDDLKVLMTKGLAAAQKSLANTTSQIPALKQAGVVDAAGQGFVDLLDGMVEFIQSGDIRSNPTLEVYEKSDAAIADLHLDDPEHRYCTECVVYGSDLDRAELQRSLSSIEASSIVVAGNADLVRIHIHVDNPASVFGICHSFGELGQQKVDDMQYQIAMREHGHKVAIVMDSAADVPARLMAQLRIGVVPVRFSFGDLDFLDRVMITPEEFYKKLETSIEYPLTSQPPVGDFSRIYNQLIGLGLQVISLNVSSGLSGTVSAAKTAAGKLPENTVEVIDTLNASVGQGLLAMLAAECAQSGMSFEAICDEVKARIPVTTSYAMTEDMSYAVRGGRVKPWIKSMSNFLRINPILRTNKKGKLVLAGIQPGRGINTRRFTQHVLNTLIQGKRYRVMVAHAQNLAKAEEIQQGLQLNPGVISCDITSVGPALGVHLGAGGIGVGVMPFSAQDLQS